MQILVSLNNLKLNNIFNKIKKIMIFSLFFLTVFSNNSIANNYKPNITINGSGLKIPRMVSLKQSLVFMRSGPGLEYPIKFEFKKKKYPMKVIAEFYNWRKVKTFNNITGWMHTQLLSSFKTGLILKATFLKNNSSNQSRSLAKLLPNLLIDIKECNIEWCKVIIVKNSKYTGWVKKELIWGSTKNNIQ